jgi:hypothetical protein
MRYVLGTLLLLVVLSPNAWAQAKEQANTSDLNPGLWEVTFQMESPFPGPVTTTEVCIAEQGKVKKPKNNPKDDCQGADEPSASNEVAYTVNCAKLKRSSRIKFTYYGDRYEGTGVIDMDGIEVHTKYTGRRIGSCDSSSNATNGGEH